MSRAHIAPWGGKSGKGASQCAPEVVGGIAMTTGKSGTAQLQNHLNAGNGHAACQQGPCDPQIHDAPIRLWVALQNVPAPHPALINLSRLRGALVCRTRWSVRRRDGRCCRGCVCVRAGLGAGGLEESFGAPRQAGHGMQDFDPRRVAAGGTAVRLLIGESGKPAQMAPVGAGAVSAIEVCQVPAHSGGQGGIQRSRTDMHPGLPVARTGPEHSARFVPVSTHHVQRRGVSFVQVDQDIAGIAVLRIGVDVDVTSLLVTGAEETDRSEVRQLSGGPKPFSGKWPIGRIVDQANEVEFTRHGQQLTADCLHGECEAEVQHALDSANEGKCRTINFQQLVSSVLTVCLSRGAHFSSSEEFVGRFRFGQLAK